MKKKGLRVPNGHKEDILPPSWFDLASTPYSKYSWCPGGHISLFKLWQCFMKNVKCSSSSNRNWRQFVSHRKVNNGRHVCHDSTSSNLSPVTSSIRLPLSVLSPQWTKLAFSFHTHPFVDGVVGGVLWNGTLLFHKTLFHSIWGCYFLENEWTKDCLENTNFMCMCVYPSVYLCTMYRNPQRSKKGIRSTGTRVTVGFKVPHEY